MSSSFCDTDTTIKIELEIYYISRNLTRLSLYSQVLIISEVTMIARVGEEGVLGLASASLKSTAAGVVDKGENSRENYFEQE